MKYCPCGSGTRYLECCGLYLEQKGFAPTPEALMRSRYSAFVEGKADYIKRTMRPPAANLFDKNSFSERNEEWLGLEVIQFYLDPLNPAIGFVEFKAKYQLNGIQGVIHELSEFHLLEGKWYYVDGKTPVKGAI